MCIKYSKYVLFLFIFISCFINQGIGQDFKVNARKIKRPDLVVTSLTAYYGTLSVNQQNKFTATIKNIGTVASPACEKMIQRGGAIQYSNLQALDPGESITITFYASFPIPNNYSVTIMADGRNAVNEFREDNNKRSVRFSVKDGGKPDLFINTLSFGTISIPGKYINLTFQVMNKPGGNVAPASKCVIKIGGESTGKEFDIPKLNPGQGYTFSRGWTPPSPADYVIRAIADSSHSIDESDENNTRIKTIQVRNNVLIAPEKRNIFVVGSIIIRKDVSGDFKREVQFQVRYNHSKGEHAGDLKILADNVDIPRYPNYTDLYRINSIAYIVKNKVKVKIRKILSYSPPKYQNLVITEGAITPIKITFPPKGYVLDIDSTPNLIISWTSGNFKSLQLKHKGNWKNPVGNSFSIPSSDFEKNKEYVLTILQKMNSLSLPGNIALYSEIKNWIFYKIKINTK